MKRLVLIPEGWHCSLAECRPGHFVSGETVGFKSEYTEDGKIQAFNEAGEFFWGGVSEESMRRKLMVQPVQPVWEEVEV